MEEVKEEEMPNAPLFANSDETLANVNVHHPTSDETIFNTGWDKPLDQTKDASYNKNSTYMRASSSTKCRRRAEYSPLPPSSPPRWSPPSPSPGVFENLELCYEEDLREDRGISDL